MVNTNRAAEAFEEFTGRPARYIEKSNLPNRDVAGWKVGDTVGIAYKATRDGKTEQYFHRFKEKARPKLISSDDGKQLFIDGGKYKVTERGIEDMPHLFIVNPSPRKKKGRSTMATRRRKRRTHRAVTVYRPNPHRRRRSSYRRRRRGSSMFRMNPVRRRGGYRRRRTLRYRRNPDGGGMLGGTFTKLIMPAIGIGLGAIGSEVAMGYLPLPASLTTGPVKHITKAAISIAGGLVLAKFLKQKRLGQAFALGGLIIAAHDTAKELIVRFAPQTKFGLYMPGAAAQGSLGYYSPAMTNSSGFGMYVPRPVTGMGEMATDYSGA